MTKLGRWLVAGTVALLICGGGGFLAILQSGHSERQALQRELKRAARLGFPSVLGEIWQGRSLKGKNAAPIYTGMNREITALYKAAEKASAVGFPETETDQAAIEDALTSAKAPLEKLEEASSLPECQFRRIASFDVPLPEYSVMQNGVKLFVARARQRASKGQPLAAMRDLERAAQISAHAGNEPLLVAAYSQTVMSERVLEGVEQILSHTPPSPDVLRQATAVLTRLGPDPAWKTFLKGEWAFRQAAFDAFDTGEMPMDQLLMLAGYNRFDAKRGPKNAAFAISMASPAGHARQRLNAARTFLDFYESVPKGAVVEVGPAFEKLDSVTESGSTEMTLARVGIPFLFDSVEAIPTYVVRRGLTRQLIGWISGAKKEGSEEVTDPFTGGPIGQKVSPTEMKLWSVGPDRKDDGGDPQKDIVVTWRRPTGL